MRSEAPISGPMARFSAQKLCSFCCKKEALQGFHVNGRIHHQRDSCLAEYRVEGGIIIDLDIRL